jgi:hypothetical protein
MLSDNGPEPSSWDRCSALSAGHTVATPPGVLDRDSAELLHELNNVFVSLLLNAQVMEWKLPSYSRLKRNLHEMQRNAQRGGEIAKRLLNRLEAMSPRGSGMCDCGTGTSDSVATEFAVADQEPELAIRGEDDTVIEPLAPPAPVCGASRKKVPHTPV